MRIDLGLIQMEIDGRPDGERPQGYESLLELYEARAGDPSPPASRSHSKPRTARSDARGPPVLPSVCLRLSARTIRPGGAGHRAQPPALLLRRQVRGTARDRWSSSKSALRADDSAACPSDAGPASTTTAGCAGRLSTEGIAAIRGFLVEYHQEDREAQCSELRFLPPVGAERSRAAGRLGAPRTPRTAARGLGGHSKTTRKPRESATRSGGSVRWTDEG